MLQRTIIQGRLEFDKERSFDQALTMYRHRVEKYYSEDLILKEEEEIFHRDQLLIDIPRTVMMTTDKYWKNTVDLIKYLAQFAIAGRVGMWIVESGRILEHYTVEPKSEKSTVKAFQKGKSLSYEEGSEEKALVQLNKVIKKYEKHSQAYERRGYINYRLENYEDALYDFDKALKFYEHNPEAFYGRARVQLKKGNLKKAIEDLESAAVCAVAHQSIYWQARKLLGETYYEDGNLEKALFNLKLFVGRDFNEDDINSHYKRLVHYKYGKILADQKRYNDAEKQFGLALEISKGEDLISDVAILNARGIVRQKKGSSGYISDWKEAANRGSKEAEELLLLHR